VANKVPRAACLVPGEGARCLCRVLVLSHWCAVRHSGTFPSLWHQHRHLALAPGTTHLHLAQAPRHRHLARGPWHLAPARPPHPACNILPILAISAA